MCEQSFCRGCSVFWVRFRVVFVLELFIYCWNQELLNKAEPVSRIWQAFPERAEFKRLCSAISYQYSWSKLMLQRERSHTGFM